MATISAKYTLIDQIKEALSLCLDDLEQAQVGLEAKNLWIYLLEHQVKSRQLELDANRELVRLL